MQKDKMRNRRFACIINLDEGAVVGDIFEHLFRQLTLLPARSVRIWVMAIAFGYSRRSDWGRP